MGHISVSNTLLEKMADFRYRSIKGFWLVLKNTQFFLGDAKGLSQRVDAEYYTEDKRRP